MKVKTFFNVVIGIITGLINWYFGGWSVALECLLVCMVIDYVSGLMVAGIWKKSRKTTTGGLSSKEGWKGLARKSITILLIGICYRLDKMLGVTYIQFGVTCAFCCNEILSITENCGLMGIPMPKAVTNAIELLNKKVYELGSNDK